MQRSGACGDSRTLRVATRLGVSIRRGFGVEVYVAIVVAGLIAGSDIDGAAKRDAARDTRGRAGGEFAVACLGGVASAPEPSMHRRLRDSGTAELVVQRGDSICAICAIDRALTQKYGFDCSGGRRRISARGAPNGSGNPLAGWPLRRVL